jgi:hypothetical protein
MAMLGIAGGGAVEAVAADAQERLRRVVAVLDAAR